MQGEWQLQRACELAYNVSGAVWKREILMTFEICVKLGYDEQDCVSFRILPVLVQNRTPAVMNTMFFP